MPATIAAAVDEHIADTGSIAHGFDLSQRVSVPHMRLTEWPCYFVVGAEVPEPLDLGFFPKLGIDRPVKRSESCVGILTGLALELAFQDFVQGLDDLRSLLPNESIQPQLSTENANGLVPDLGE